MQLRRIISFGLLSLMLVVQVHDALPHHFTGEAGTCSATCHNHHENDANWWSSLMDGVHDVLHQHASSMNCDEGQDFFEPAQDLACDDPLPLISGLSGNRWDAMECRPDLPRVKSPLRLGSLRGTPHRGPPVRG